MFIMTEVKLHGVTLDQEAIAEFYPKNSAYPDFDYFLFHYNVDEGGDYYFDVYAVDKSGDILKEITAQKNNPAVPIDYDIWIAADVTIQVSYQLDRLSLGANEVIKRMRLTPGKYKKNYAGYEVKIQIGRKELIDVFKYTNPSPPATSTENTW